MKRRRFFILCTLGSAGLGGLGWKAGRSSRIPKAAMPSANLREFSRSGRALGTNVNCTVFAPGEAQGEEALTAVFAEIERVESLMSIYRENSQISRLNRDGALRQPDPDLIKLLRMASELSRQSDGAFDVTVQPLWDLHANCARSGRLPLPGEIEQARQSIDWRNVVIRDDLGIELKANARITLNGIAQGFAADAACLVLGKHGIHHAILDTGEIGPLGHHPQRDHWNVGIKHPRKAGELLGIARLDQRCLATSGDYETSFSEDHRSHHLFDPFTGRSATACSSVSVVAPTATEADALSTAAFVLGMEKGLALIESHPHADALFVGRDGQLLRSAGFPMEIEI